MAVAHEIITYDRGGHSSVTDNHELATAPHLQLEEGELVIPIDRTIHIQAPNDSFTNVVLEAEKKEKEVYKPVNDFHESEGFREARKKVLYLIIIPDIHAGLTAHQIAEKYGVSLQQVQNARKNARARGVLPRISDEELRESRKKSHAEQGLGEKKQLASFQTLLEMTERRRGRGLTDMEKNQLSLLVKARNLPNLLNAQTIDEFFVSYGRSPIYRGKKRAFLELIYASWIWRNRLLCGKLEDKVGITVDEIERVYGDSDLFEKAKEEILFMRDVFGGRAARIKHVLPRQ